jgi:ribonuclease BN (tRNA processing enzyme)
MRLFIGGMRGSQPSTGAGFEEFGGDTTSLLLVGSHGERLALDAGTGMRAVADQLANTGAGEVTVLFSHYHLDHMAGLMMNPLLYGSDWSFRFIGPTLGEGGVRDAVAGLLRPPYWPIAWEQMGAKLGFSEFPPQGIHVGRLLVQGCPVPHPGGCVAYRIDDADGASFVFATDLEWQNRTDVFETAFMTMCRKPKPADMLAIDAHFGRENEKAFAGWGHSSWQDCLEIARSAGVARVLLGHHAPEADDRTLRRVEQQVKKLSPGSMLARAGQWLTVDG